MTKICNVARAISLTTSTPIENHSNFICKKWCDTLFALFILIVTIFKLRVGVFDTTLIGAIFSILLIAKNIRIVLPITFAYFFSVWILLNCYIGLIADPGASLLTIIRSILTIFNIIVVVSFLKIRFEPYQVLNLLGVILLIHPIFIVSEILLPTQAIVFEEIFDWVGHKNDFRVRGLFNSTSSAGAFLGFCNVFWQYLYFKIGIKWPRYIIVFTFFLFPITALSGLIISLVGSLAIAAISTSILQKTLRFYVTMVFLMTILTLIADRAIDQYFLNQPIYYVKELIKNRTFILIGMEGVSTQSGNPRVSLGKLSESYSFPSKNVFFGNGFESKSEGATTGSDAGFIAKFHQIGIFGLIYVYAFAIYLARRNTLTRILVLCWAVAFFKNDYFFSRYFFDLIFLVFMLQDNRKINEKIPRDF